MLYVLWEGLAGAVAGDGVSTSMDVCAGASWGLAGMVDGTGLTSFLFSSTIISWYKAE